MYQCISLQFNVSLITALWKDGVNSFWYVVDLRYIAFSINWLYILLVFCSTEDPKALIQQIRDANMQVCVTQVLGICCLYVMWSPLRLHFRIVTRVLLGFHGRVHVHTFVLPLAHSAHMKRNTTEAWVVLLVLGHRYVFLSLALVANVAMARAKGLRRNTKSPTNRRHLASSLMSFSLRVWEWLIILLLPWAGAQLSLLPKQEPGISLFVILQASSCSWGLLYDDCSPNHGSTLMSFTVFPCVLPVTYHSDWVDRGHMAKQSWVVVWCQRFLIWFDLWSCLLWLLRLASESSQTRRLRTCSSWLSLLTWFLSWQ